MNSIARKSLIQEHSSTLKNIFNLNGQSVEVVCKTINQTEQTLNDLRNLLAMLASTETTIDKAIDRFEEDFCVNDVDDEATEYEDADDDTDDDNITVIVNQPYTRLVNEDGSIAWVPTPEPSPAEKVVFKCPVEGCNVQLSSKLSLNNHINRHTLERDQKCTVEGCGKGFKTKSELNTHMDSHSNEPTYKCDKCDCKYKQKNSLALHKRKKHPVTV